jgi:hypothetical protein
MWASTSLLSLPTVVPSWHSLQSLKAESRNSSYILPILYTPPASRLDCTPYSTVREVAASARRSWYSFGYVRRGEGTEHCANADCSVTFVSVLIVYLSRSVTSGNWLTQREKHRRLICGLAQ